jgi:hypothetical protein
MNYEKKLTHHFGRPLYGSFLSWKCLLMLAGENGRVQRL